MERKQLNEADLRAARDYLRMRLDAEASMIANLDAVMGEAARRVVEVCYKYSVNPKDFNFDADPRIRVAIEEIVEWLREVIMDMLYTLATAKADDERERIWLWIRRRREGATLDERLDKYLGNFTRELELLIGAGLFLGLAEKVTADSISRHLRRPWNNPDLADGVKAPLTYGRGRTNSMTTAIGALTKFGVGEGWMRVRHEQAQRRDAVGFYTFRNSTVACDICDGYAEVFHLMDEPTPPLHGSCVCGTLYVDAMGMPINL